MSRVSKRRPRPRRPDAERQGGPRPCHSWGRRPGDRNPRPRTARRRPAPPAGGSCRRRSPRLASSTGRSPPARRSRPGGRTTRSRKVGRIGDGALVLGDQAEPQERAPNEGGGGQKVDGRLAGQRHQQKADQPHVVIQRQPGHPRGRSGRPAARRGPWWRRWPSGLRGSPRRRAESACCPRRTAGSRARPARPSTGSKGPVAAAGRPAIPKPSGPCRPRRRPASRTARRARTRPRPPAEPSIRRTCST